MEYPHLDISRGNPFDAEEHERGSQRRSEDPELGDENPQCESGRSPGTVRLNEIVCVEQESDNEEHESARGNGLAQPQPWTSDQRKDRDREEPERIVPELLAVEVSVHHAREQVVERADGRESEETPAVGVYVRLHQAGPSAGNLPDVREQAVCVRGSPQKHERRNEVEPDTRIPRAVALHDHLEKKYEQAQREEPDEVYPEIERERHPE